MYEDKDKIHYLREVTMAAIPNGLLQENIIQILVMIFG